MDGKIMGLIDFLSVNLNFKHSLIYYHCRYWRSVARLDFKQVLILLIWIIKRKNIYFLPKFKEISWLRI